MLVVVSDTHSKSDHRLAGRTLEAVESADLVVHAGDFVQESVLDAFEAIAPEFIGVAGNVDDTAIHQRLRTTEICTYGDFRIVVTHTREGGMTALELFGRELGADLVIFGHSHRPEYRWTGSCGLLNPGSHAEPRGNRPAHAEIRVDGDTLSGKLVQPDGNVFEHFTIRKGQED